MAHPSASGCDFASPTHTLENLELWDKICCAIERRGGGSFLARLLPERQQRHLVAAGSSS